MTPEAIAEAIVNAWYARVSLNQHRADIADAWRAGRTAYLYSPWRPVRPYQ